MKFNKVLFLLTAISILSTAVCCGQKKKAKNNANYDDVKLSTQLDSVSYSMGMSIGSNIKTQGVDSVNYEAFVKGLQNAISGGDTLITMEQSNNLLSSYFNNLQQKKMQKNVEAGKKFLEENKTKEGVVTLPSGLQYKIIKAGTGPKPTANDKVKTHYHGTLIDGTVFDSSVQRGEPISFPVNGVIKGWTEALQLMPVGSKWMLYIPSDLAYGDRGAGQQIGPNSTLIFEVELLEIEK